MKNKFLACLVVFLVFLPLACGGEKKAEKMPSLQLKLTGDTEAVLRKGQVLEVALAANPTTGYIWQAQGLGADSVVRQLGEAGYIQDTAKLIGGGGVMTFKFEAVKKGTEDIYMVHRRPWEEEKEPIEKYKLEIEVR